jgi:hypothetical protein
LGFECPEKELRNCQYTHQFNKIYEGRIFPESRGPFIKRAIPHYAEELWHYNDPVLSLSHHYPVSFFLPEQKDIPGFNRSP